MKRFIVSVLFVAVFFVGLGTLVEKAGAKFKSDDRALAVVARTRTALGGEQNLAAVRSLIITGRVTKNIDVEGAMRSEQGDVEMAMQLPDKFSRMMRFGKGEGAGAATIEKTLDVVVVDGKEGGAKVKIVKADGEPVEKKMIRVHKPGEGETVIADGKTDLIMVRRSGDGNGTWTTENDEKVVIKEVAGKAMPAGEWKSPRQNELLRTSIALLLTAPEGMEVGYTYVGEESVDGNSCDVINVESAGTSFRMYIDKASSLPRMISYEAPKPMIFMATVKGDKMNDTPAGGEVRVISRAGAPADGAVKVFDRTAALEKAQFQVKFSDYRSVNGVQLPFRWTQTVGGRDDESIDITGYDVNPANIADKFSNQHVFVRTKKPE